MSGSDAITLGDRYRLLGERATFPFGALCEGEDDQGARTLILRFHPEVAEPAEKVRNALEVSSAIVSPSVVAWADGGVDDGGQGWVAAPMFGPWSLSEHITRNEGLTPADAGPIMHQLARALAAGEKLNHVHHALSSELVRLIPIPEGGYAIKLYGYGLSTLLPPYKPLKKKNAFIGVPDYMSPELCAGKPADGKADIYAVGIMLYESIRGRPPFAPTFASASASTTLKRQIFEKPLPLHVRYGRVAHIKAYESIAMTALAKQANRRQAAMAGLSDELHDLVATGMGGMIVPEGASSTRPVTTSRKSRTQVLQAVSAEDAHAAKAEEEAEAAKQAEAEAAAAAQAEADAQAKAAAEAEAAAQAEADAQTEAEADGDQADDDAAARRAPQSTLVFAGLGPKVRELAEAAREEDDAKAATDSGDDQPAAQAEADAAPAPDKAPPAEAKSTEDSSEGEGVPGSRKGRRRRKKKKKKKRSEIGTRPEFEAPEANATVSAVAADTSAAKDAAVADKSAAEPVDDAGADATLMGVAAAADVTARIRNREQRTMLDVEALKPKPSEGTDEQDAWFVSSAEQVAEIERDEFIVQKKSYFWVAAIPVAIAIVILIYFLTSGATEPTPPPSTPTPARTTPQPTMGPTPTPAGAGATATAEDLIAAQNRRDMLRSTGTAPVPTEPAAAPTEPAAAPTEPAAAPTEPAAADPSAADPAAVAAAPAAPSAADPGAADPAAAVADTGTPVVTPTPAAPTPTEVAPAPTPAPSTAAAEPAPTAPVAPVTTGAAANTENAARAAAEIHYRDGRVAHARGDLNTAARAFRNALEADPSMSEARRALNVVRAKQRQAATDNVAAVPAPKPVEPKPAEPKPAEPKPVEAKPAEPKPAEPKPAAAPAKPAGDAAQSFRDQSKHYIKLGLAAYKKGQYKVAAGYFTKAQSLDGSNPVAARYLKLARDNMQ